MPLSFRSYRSSSSGNCLALWTGSSSILIDCGVRTLRDCRALLQAHQASHGRVDGVLVTHVHGDHCTLDALRVLGEAGIPVYAHRRVVPQLHARHGAPSSALATIRAFGDTFSIGEFEAAAIELPHAPGVPTYGFVLRTGEGAERRSVVIATDFNDAAALLPHLAGASFVFIEANHDLDLLRRRFNRNSLFHLNNGATARALCQAVLNGGCAPATVVLGHLSDERNLDELALSEVHEAFRREGTRVPFELETAPRFTASRVFRIG
jgi:phosphoribosyl 1,2-cyclic phosphodiesterase